MNPLRIIDACTEEHFVAMSRTHARGWHTAYPGHVPDDYLRDVITENRRIPFFREDYVTGRCQGLLFCDGDTPVCCCTYGPARLGPSPRQSEGLAIYGEAYRGWEEIISFRTDPACTGRDYGSVLIEEALCRLRVDGYLNCYVFVLRENEGARRFYTRYGFTWDGTEEHIPFPHNITCVDSRYTEQLWPHRLPRRAADGYRGVSSVPVFFDQEESLYRETRWRSCRCAGCC